MNGAKVAIDRPAGFRQSREFAQSQAWHLAYTYWLTEIEIVTNIARRRIYLERVIAMIDRTTKLLLAAIALGLWLNIAAPVLRIGPARAAETDNQLLSSIKYVLVGLYNGECKNNKLC